MLWKNIKTGKICDFLSLPTRYCYVGSTPPTDLYVGIPEDDDFYPGMYLTPAGEKQYFRLWKYWDFLDNKECLNWAPDEHHLECPNCHRVQIIFDDHLEATLPVSCVCGIAPDYDETYHPAFNSAFRIKIKRRDSCTCRICKTKDNLAIHHINYDKNNDCSSPKDFLTVCVPCNSSLNANRPEQIKRCNKIISKIYS